MYVRHKHIHTHTDLLFIPQEGNHDCGWHCRQLPWASEVTDLRKNFF